MPPKRKKPGAPNSKGFEVISVTDVEAGVNSHASISGSGKSGSNLTEKDKVDFLCLLRQMTVSSGGSGDRTNSGSPSISKHHPVGLIASDPPGAQSSQQVVGSPGNSPQWQYLNYQDILQSQIGNNGVMSAEQLMKGQNTKNSWPEVSQVGVADLNPSKASVSQERSWPAHPQQTKVVRPQLQQLPLPHFPPTQHPSMPLPQGALPQPQPQSSFQKVPHPQHPLAHTILQQHIPQYPQPQRIHLPTATQPESPVLSPGIRPQNPFAQSGTYLPSHQGLPQHWQAQPILHAQLPQSPRPQHPLAVSPKQPFIQNRAVLNQQNILHTGTPQDLQHLQYQIREEQIPNSHPFPNSHPLTSQSQLMQNQPKHHPQHQVDASKVVSHSDVKVSKPPQTGQDSTHLSQPNLKPMAQQQRELQDMMKNVSLQGKQQSNPGTSSQHKQTDKPPRGAQPGYTPGGRPNQGNWRSKPMPAEQKPAYKLPPPPILRLALNFVEFEGERPFCMPCRKNVTQDKIIQHLKQDVHKEHVEAHLARITCYDMPSISDRQNAALTNFLERQVDQLRVTKTQKTQVDNVVARLNSLAEQHLNGCKVRLYGSLATGMALKDDLKINADLEVPISVIENPQKVFREFVVKLEECGIYRDFESSMVESFSSVSFVDVESGLSVGLSLNNTAAFKLSKLLAEYAKLDERVLKLGILFRAWGKMCQVDKAEEGGWLPHAFPLLVIFFLQRVRVIPVLHELANNRERDPDVYLDAKAAKSWKTKPVSLGVLWIDLFYFYLCDHDVGRHVVCVTQFQRYERSQTNWRAKRIAIIDPFQPKRNVACHTSYVMAHFIDDCFLWTQLYFSIPQRREGPAFGTFRKLPSWFIHEFNEAANEFSRINRIVTQLVLTTDAYGPTRPDVVNHRADLRKQLKSSPLFSQLVMLHLSGEVPLFPEVVFEEYDISPPKENSCSKWSLFLSDRNVILAQFDFKQAYYVFSKDKFTNGSDAPVWCTSCQTIGHRRSACPEEKMPVPEVLPLLSEEAMNVLNTLCGDICTKLCASEEEIASREAMRIELIDFIRQKYPDADLSIFGSSNNGFGSRQSDVDLCLTFLGNSSGEGLDFSSMINKIATILYKHQHVNELNAVSMAKVPIVKFTWKKDFQVDISLYNRLGRENTKLLKAYSQIDPRVRPLVYMMKRFVKTACIGDASRGSLSSYAYTLMVLYFLQQIEPPILPVLQELADPGETPRKIKVENANVYFYDNLEKLNEKEVGQLWLDILDFYVSPEFHRLNKVISIRQKKPLYKFDKMWTSVNMCIEDPFDLTHNLGSGLSRRMNVHILNTFLRARRHFGSPVVSEPGISTEDYFFNADVLMPGKPPCDRGCRHCGHIGHNRDECPEKRKAYQETRQKKKQGNNSEKSDKAEQSANDKRTREQSVDEKSENMSELDTQSSEASALSSPNAGEKTRRVRTRQQRNTAKAAKELAGNAQSTSTSGVTAEPPVETNLKPTGTSQPKVTPKAENNPGDAESECQKAGPKEKANKRPPRLRKDNVPKLFKHSLENLRKQEVSDQGSGVPTEKPEKQSVPVHQSPGSSSIDPSSGTEGEGSRTRRPRYRNQQKRDKEKSDQQATVN